MSVYLCVYVCLHHNITPYFVKCGQIATKLRDITGIGRSHQICGKHIIVDNSGTIHRINIKLVPIYFERQDDFVTS